MFLILDTDEYELNGEPSGIGNGKDVNNQAKKTAARPARPNAPIMILSSDEDVADKISSGTNVKNIFRIFSDFSQKLF